MSLDPGTITWTEAATISDEYQKVLSREKHLHPLIVDKYGTLRWVANEDREHELMREFEARDLNDLFLKGASKNDPKVRELYRHMGVSLFMYWEVFYWKVNNEDADDYSEETSRMKDYFDNQLNLGDEVAFYAPGYRQYTTGTIIAFTPKQVRVEYMNTWNYGTPGFQKTYLAYPDMFIKKVT